MTFSPCLRFYFENPLLVKHPCCWGASGKRAESSGRRQRGSAGAETRGEAPAGLFSACSPPFRDTGDSRGMEGVLASAAQMWGCESPPDLFLHSVVAKRSWLPSWQSFAITVWFKAAVTNGTQNSFAVQLYSKWHLTALSECWWMFFN